MKQFILFVAGILLITTFCFSQKHAHEKKIQSSNNVKQFWFVLLLKGNNRTQDSATAAKIQDGHMANIKR